MTTEKSGADALLKRAYSLSNDDEAKALYHDWAETYDETMLDGLAYATPRKTAQLLAERLTEKSARILDVGSGTGLAGHYLLRHGFSNIDALDYSREMLAVAEKRKIEGRKVYTRTIEADLNKELAIEDNSYDALICTGTFTHCHVGAQSLNELFRILKPAGLFACTVHKDVWEPQGFAAETRKLAEKGVMQTLGMTMGTYYDTAEEPEGWFIVWKKCT